MTNTEGSIICLFKKLPSEIACLNQSSDVHRSVHNTKQNKNLNQPKTCKDTKLLYYILYKLWMYKQSTHFLCYFTQLHLDVFEKSCEQMEGVNSLITSDISHHLENNHSTTTDRWTNNQAVQLIWCL